jgi:hypothetical protein
LEIPLRFVVNGVVTTINVTLRENALVMQGFSIPIDKSLVRGWGRVELPADAWAGNNVFHFVFDEPPVLRSVVLSDDPVQSAPLQAVLSAAADPTRKYLATTLPSGRAAEIPWEETAFILWQATLPKTGDPLRRQLEAFVAAGRRVLFLPPDSPDESELFGMRWAPWGPAQKPEAVEWWRNDADLLANTRDGTALPLGTMEVSRRCGIAGNGVPLARVGGKEPLLIRSATDPGAYFLGTLPDPASSSLARDGVVLFAMLHRALHEGVRTLGKAQQNLASTNALGSDGSVLWHRVEDPASGGPGSENMGFRAGALEGDSRLLALNRPPAEDDPEVLSEAALGELFAGLDFRVLTDSLEDGRSLTSEVWRTFVLAMAVALLGETLLCLPARREPATRPRAPVGAGFHTRGGAEG